MVVEQPTPWWSRLEQQVAAALNARAGKSRFVAVYGVHVRRAETW